MNKEIYSVIENMKKHCPSEPDITHGRPDVIQNYQLIQMARLSVLLAEESERQAEKIKKYTKALVWLTLSLIFIGFVQIAMMIFDP